MSLIERLEQASGSILASVVLAFISGGVWVVRRVFTNQKQIEMLQAEIKNRDEQRKEDREDLKEVKSDVRSIREDLNKIFQNRSG